MSLKRAVTALVAAEDPNTTTITTNPKRNRHEESSAIVVEATVETAAQLPRPLFTRVLAFAVSGFVPAEKCAPQRPNLPIHKLRTMALVSTEWKNAVRAVVQEFIINVFQVKLLDVQSEDDFEELQSEFERRGDQLLDVRVTIDAKLKPKDLALLDWDALFTKCPKLQRLDLQNVPLEHSALGLILDAASSSCLEMESLIFSKSSSTTKAAKKVSAANYSKLYEALEKWSEADTHIKQLTVPNRQEDDAMAPTTKLLEVVAEFCPSLEFLDGWKAAYKVEDFVECDEKWYISPSTWTQFCESTGSSLREFNWAVAPFHDDYFQIFAASPKPKLQRLCLTVSESWSWDDFKFQEEQQKEDKDNLLPEELVSPPTADTLSLVIRAVPHLEQLYVILHSNMEEPSSVDADAFGDDFLSAIAGSCRSLTEIKLVEIDAGQEIAPISTISSEGITALSQLDSLQNVVITGVEGRELGVFAFIKHWQDSKRQRTVDIGIDQGESGRAFYDEALDLLTKILNDLDDEEDGDEVVPKIAVKVRNLTTDPDFKSKNLKTFCKDWNKSVREIKTKRPWLRIAIEADGVLEEGSVSAFSTIGKIVVFSKEADLDVFDKLASLSPPAISAVVVQTIGKGKRESVESVETQSSQENQSSSVSEDDDSEGYGSVVEESESSEATSSDSEPEAPAPRRRNRKPLKRLKRATPTEESDSEAEVGSEPSASDSTEILPVDSADSD